MVTGKRVLNDFSTTIEQALDNTLNFENSSSFSKYDFEDTDVALGSVFGLCEQRNYIIEELIPYLKENADMRGFSEDEAEQYAYRPMELSFYLYGVIDYWWILLAVNGYLNPRDFHSFTKLIIPAKTDIESIVDKEIYSNSSIGEIPS